VFEAALLSLVLLGLGGLDSGDLLALHGKTLGGLPRARAVDLD